MSEMASTSAGAGSEQEEDLAATKTHPARTGIRKAGGVPVDGGALKQQEEGTRGIPKQPHCGALAGGKERTVSEMANHHARTKGKQVRGRRGEAGAKSPQQQKPTEHAGP